MSEAYILGAILSKIGLTFDDACKIENGQLKLNKSSQEIRDFLLENSEIKTFFLRKLVNYGFNLQELADRISININELNANVDNGFYWLNGINFAMKINSSIRKRIGCLLYGKGYSYKMIGELLEVSATTIHSDKRGFWQ